MYFGIPHFDARFKRAIEFANLHHGDQMYGDAPYLTHLVQVAMTLVRFGYHPGVGTLEEQDIARNLLVAAILHDVIEDTEVTRQEVIDEFGEEVALLVYAVTNEPGRNRKERHARSHPKLFSIPHAMTLKLADRIANVENCHATGSNLLYMYRKEWKAFKEKLFDKAEAPEIMWNYLEQLICRVRPKK